MNRLNYYLDVKFLILYALLVVLAGCKNEIITIEATKNESAVILFGDQAEESDIVLISNNNLVMVGTGDSGYARLVSCFNNDGLLLWEHKLSTKAVTRYSSGVVLSDGSVLINSFQTSNYITKISASGELIYHKQYNLSDVYGRFSALVLGDDGYVYFSYQRNGAGIQPQRIIKLDHINGELISTLYFPDGIWGGNGGPSQFYITSFTNGKFFTISYANNKSTIWGRNGGYKTSAYFYPETNKYEPLYHYDSFDFRHIACYANTPERVYYVASSSSLIHYAPTYFYNSFALRSINKSLYKDLDVDIELDVFQINARNIRVINNELFVIGDCIRKGEEKWSGFILKFDLKGNMLQEKYFLLDDDTHLTDINQVGNNYILLGHTVSFGKGKEQNNRFYLRTDKELNY
jgi:hypothetical protein